MPHRPAVIELVGPAGVGKTTLALQLEARGQGRRGTMWLVPFPLLARSTLRQLPTLVSLYRETGAVLWDEFKHLARQDALRAFVQTSRWNGTRLVVLDEGPVYTLSWLQVMGHPRFRDGARPRFWRQTLERWATGLDAVVVLDAADDVLAARIRAREKPHLVKDSSADAVSTFVAAYREATERVLVDLENIGGPTVLRLDCSSGSDVHERLLATLAQSVHAY